MRCLAAAFSGSWGRGWRGVGGLGWRVAWEVIFETSDSIIAVGAVYERFTEFREEELLGRGNSARNLGRAFEVLPLIRSLSYE